MVPAIENANSNSNPPSIAGENLNSSSAPKSDGRGTQSGVLKGMIRYVTEVDPRKDRLASRSRWSFGGSWIFRGIEIRQNSFEDFCNLREGGGDFDLSRRDFFPGINRSPIQHRRTPSMNDTFLIPEMKKRL